jgi:hypothetical protein
MSSLGFVLLGTLAVIVGALIPIQAATNAAMSRAIGSVAITSLALFAIGFVVVAAWAIVIREPLPSLETLRHVPAYGYFGGFIVASYVIAITFLAPRLGVGNAIRLRRNRADRRRGHHRSCGRVRRSRATTHDGSCDWRCVDDHRGHSCQALDGSLLMKHLMNKGDGNRSFADSGRHALDVAVTHVAHGEDSGMIRFQ